MKMNFKSIVVTALVAFLAGGLGGWLGYDIAQDSSPSSSQYQGVDTKFIDSESDLISAIAEEVGQSVVSINVATSQTSFFFGDFESVGSGTGIIISQDGYIVTNRHVIAGSDEIEIIMADGTTYDDVTVVGRDPRDGVDIAFLKINGVNDLKPARIGDSDTVRVGDKVVAIGNALGEFQNSVTTGIISGRSRPIVAGDSRGSEALTDLLQTDAAINPGNSGGPLVNINGEVIGINTAVANGENIGFAIAISNVAGSINSVIQTGEFSVPYIGVRYVTITENYADANDLPSQTGAHVFTQGDLDAVLDGSPADKAGIRGGDIIISVDGTQVNQENGLSSLIGRKGVGETVELEIIRGDETLTIAVELEAAPDAF